jgi:hypothetical protein
MSASEDPNNRFHHDNPACHAICQFESLMQIARQARVAGEAYVRIIWPCGCDFAPSMAQNAWNNLNRNYSRVTE